MEFYDVIHKRRTIRDFTHRPVDEEVIVRILSAGMKAPTNDHMRSWEFVVITDKEVVASLINKIPKTMSEKRVDFILNDWGLQDSVQIDMYKASIPKQYKMLFDAGSLILPFFKQSHDLLKPVNLSALNPFASIWCCIENILLAATAEGLGAVMRIPMGQEFQSISETIKHPKDYIMPCFIAIGHPAPDAQIHKQKDYNIKDKIHINKW